MAAIDTLWRHERGETNVRRVAEASLRVALLTPRFWPDVRRGTERHVHELARGLLELGHRPLVVTRGRRPKLGDVDGVRVARLPRAPGGFGLVATLHAFRPHVAHAFHLADANAGLAWTARTGRPLAYTHMGIPDGADVAASPGGVDAVRRTVAGCTAVVTLSRHSAEAFRATLGSECRLIHPGVSLERFPVGAERTREPTVVCSAAVAEPRKRVGLLVEAWPAVRREHPDARLLLDRRGAEALGSAPPGVDLVAMDDTAELARLNGMAWAAALPSTSEAFGLVLVEALATGTPVVATDSAALPEIVDRPQIGRLFDGTSSGLADALLATFRLAGDPATRTACRARAEDFSASRMVDAHATLYAGLVSARAIAA